jgi:hypothetical protein
MLRLVVWQKFTYVSEVLAASIIMARENLKSHVLSGAFIVSPSFVSMCV